MKIQQYSQFKMTQKFYSPLKFFYDFKIVHVAMFLYRVDGYVYRAGGPIPFLNDIQTMNGECSMTFETVDLNVDLQNNLIYIGEVFGPYEADMTDDEFNIKYNNMNALQLCQNNITDCAVMTKDNFIHLLTAWLKFYDTNTMPPFVLLYQDDKGWYDSLPFDTQEAMEKFVADHTQQETTQK